MNSLFISNILICDKKVRKIGGSNLKQWEENAERVKYVLMIMAIILGVYLSFRYLLPLFFPFLVAYFLAWIVRPITEFLYKKLKIPRVVGGTASLIVLFFVVGAGLCYLFNLLTKQAITFIKNIPVYTNILAEKLEHLCKCCDEFLGMSKGTFRSIVDDNISITIDKMKTSIMPRITERTITFTITFISAIGIVLIIFVAAALMTKEIPSLRTRYEDNHFYRDLHKVTSKLAEAGIAYIRSQLIIMVIVAIISVVGLTIMNNEYALLIGVGIAIMDALPILGSGIIYIPWAIIMLIDGNIFAAAILITIYLLSQIIREVLEPKLIGNRIGIKPLYTLISMYVGVKLFSIVGFFLGPIGLLIIITIYKVVCEKSQETRKSQEISFTED